jgi:hypothetical protein
VSLAIDLGRHRTYGARYSSAGNPADELIEAELLRLSATDAGLLLRCDLPGQPRRFTEALIATAGYDSDAANKLTAQACAVLSQALDESTGDSERRERTVVAVPVALGPTGRRILLDGLSSVAIDAKAKDLIERPIAALAEWLSDREKVGGDPPTEPVAVIDNDGGEISVLVADTKEKKLLAIAPVSLGPLDKTEDVVHRIKAVLDRGAARLADAGPLRNDDWTSVSASFGHVVLSGSGAEHPTFQNLITGLLPAAPIAARSSVKAAHAVVAGLTALEKLADWTCCWPTGQILLDGESIRRAGPLVKSHEEMEIHSTTRSHLSFADADGNRSSIQVSTVLATGVWIPQALGSVPKMRLLDDGRVLLLGAPGVRPLSFVVHWPIPCQTNSQTLDPPILVSPLGRRALGLVSPRVDRTRQAKAE